MLEDDRAIASQSPAPLHAGANRARAMPLPSVLFLPGMHAGADSHAVTDYFGDLNLDQIMAGVAARSPDHDLMPFLTAPLRGLDAIAYRQEVMRDLEGESVMTAVKAFSVQMHEMRTYLDHAKKGYYKEERERWFLDAAALYGDAVARLREDLSSFELQSRGLRAFRDFLAHHVASPAFLRPIDAAHRLREDLAAIRYCLLIDGDSITVRHYDGEDDYRATVTETFEKFRRAAAKNYLSKIPERTGMNHVMAQIVERIARLHPEVFGRLEAFCAEHAAYLDETVARFDREIQFYVACLDYIAAPRQTGLSFCYPRLSTDSKEVSARDAFDLALAAKLAGTETAVISNDFSLTGPERLLVVSGPNQGGKTTFARMFGQLHYLASLGFPVPGSQARLFLCDRIFTHFEREEDIANLRGKLHDDLFRIRQILDAASPNSLIVINEIFSSTTLTDAIELGRRIMGKISRLDALGVCVTFLTELAAFDAKTVSYVSQIDPDDPVVRTYKVLREAANGLSYALAIARKHGVTYNQIKGRIGP
jgi:hypothetical protein